MPETMDGSGPSCPAETPQDDSPPTPISSAEEPENGPINKNRSLDKPTSEITSSQTTLSNDIMPPKKAVGSPRKRAAPKRDPKPTKTELVLDESTLLTPEESPVKKRRTVSPRKKEAKAKIVEEETPEEGQNNPDVDGMGIDDSPPAPTSRIPFTKANTDEIPGNFSSEALSQNAVHFLMNTIVENATMDKKWSLWAKMMKDCGCEITGGGLKKQMEKVWLARLQGMYKD
ncbi:hypothetical protein EX30DRAFT_338254 [Ascodesmis nigricans]|uniref:Uncharacterized protein n=1 Tax=Ascodesmis nigricans TaxID=341454 RepID=A0A4S2N392_9PEZI|nr:hypothetical protein EX30DRAFT_338254 [Ascodesmis nigricans]